MNYILIEKPTMREAIKEMIKEGIRPLTIEEIWELRKEGKIKDQWYTAGTLWYQGKFQHITFQQMKDIENIYADGGRLLCLGDLGYGGLVSNYDLDYNARILGEKVRRRT